MSLLNTDDTKVVEQTGSTFDLIEPDETEEDKLDLSEKKTEEVEEEKEEEKTEETEDEEIELETKEEVEDDIRPLPTRKEILAKFPTLYKEFPQLNNAFYRERQFTEIIGDPSDAKELVQKGRALDNFESYLKSGETEKVLQVIKENSPEAFNKVVDNYLITLGKVDNNAYGVVLGNIIKTTISAMAVQSKKSGNEDLRKAAEILNEFVFMTSDFEPPVKLSKEEKKDDTVSKREQEFTIKQFNSAKDTLNTKVDNVLRSTIDAYIDPKDSMPPYVRKNAVREVLESLPDIMRTDTRFESMIQKLWERAHRENYSVDSVDRIKSAWLNKAKTVLPAVIKKVRGEALKGLGKREKTSEEEETPKRGPAPVGKTASSPISGKSLKEKARAIPVGVSTKDYLLSED